MGIRRNQRKTGVKSAIRGTTYENVYFHHTDASGMSSRLSYNNGSALTGESFEDAPTEADPLGGNMGTETPYVEFPPEPPPPDEDFPAFVINDADPVWVSGQRATITLDGMTLIGPVADALLRNGLFGNSYLPEELARYQHNPGFRFEDRGLGIYIPTLAHLKNVPRGELGYGDIVFRGPTFLSGGWGVSTEPQRQTQERLTEKQKSGLQSELESFTKDKTCNDFISKVLEKLKSTGKAGYDGTDINKLLEALLGNSNNSFYSVNNLEQWSRGLIKGRVHAAWTNIGSNWAGKTTTMRLDSYVFGYSSGKTLVYSQYEAMIVLVHELFHAYGKRETFLHSQIARSAFEAASDMNMQPARLPVIRIDPETGEEDLVAFDSESETYFKTLLRRACAWRKQ